MTPQLGFSPYSDRYHTTVVGIIMWPVVSLLRQAPRCQLMKTHGNRPGFLISCVRATAMLGGVSFESQFWEKKKNPMTAGVNTGLWSQRTRGEVCGSRPDMETPGWRLVGQRRIPAKRGFFQRGPPPPACGYPGSAAGKGRFQVWFLFSLKGCWQ